MVFRGDGPYFGAQKEVKMLFIDIYSALIEFSSCNLNKNITYRHYSYVSKASTEKYSLPGYPSASRGLKRGRNVAKMLITDNFSTVMPYIPCKLNGNVTYRHYRYIWAVCPENIRYRGNHELPGCQKEKGEEMGINKHQMSKQPRFLFHKVSKSTK